MPLAPLTKPLVFFDLETTGLLMELDRIIEIGLVKFNPDGTTFRLTQRFNPGIRIPVESSAIHGLVNEDLDQEPRFVDLAPRLFEIFTDADLGGFALHRLDIPLLTKEFERAGFAFSMEGRRIVDVSIIFREKERRDLRTAYHFYCGKDLVGAHGAQADNDATYDVLLAQLERYPDLPRDVAGLHAFCRVVEKSHVDPDGKLVWRDGRAFFNFGKHRFQALEEVAKEDRDYLEWVVQKANFPLEFTHICRAALQGIFPHRVAPPKAQVPRLA
jgi:DNA polymerase-3 subunit epsilon